MSQEQVENNSLKQNCNHQHMPTSYDEIQKHLEQIRPQLDQIIVKDGLYQPAFAIYGGVAGLYDLGTIATQVVNNLKELWRQFFVVGLDLEQVQGTCLVPENVLQASGHVAKFCDLMIKDVVTGECFRADKIIEDFAKAQIELNEMVEQKQKLTELQQQQHRKIPTVELQHLENTADGMTVQQTDEAIKHYNILSKNGNKFSEPFAFNLMFKTSIGPSSQSVCYLRPETAQGIFMNFKKAFEQRKSLPFGIAQIGTAFRNEIAPRNGLLRVREFDQMEIEYFLGENDQVNVEEFGDVTCNIFSAPQQMNEEPMYENISLREALEKKVIKNPFIAMFIAMVQQFLCQIGLNKNALRFRQHLPQQLAHYAQECFDCDCLMSCGWVEIVGIADRGNYDLSVHKQYITLEGTEKQNLIQVKCVMKEIVKADKLNAQAIKKALETATQEELIDIQKQIEQTGKFVVKSVCSTEIDKAAVKFTTISAAVPKQYVPHVVEPSFGVGRILTALLEHSFYQREEDKNRCVFAFKSCIAPYKVAVVALMQKPELTAVSQRIVKLMRQNGISCKTDESSVQIGKKYVRFDEIGCCYTITVDYDGLTVRERDSMKQVRVQESEIVDWIKQHLK